MRLADTVRTVSDPRSYPGSRRRVLAFGVGLFAAASLLCGPVPSPEQLIVPRAVQGVGAALDQVGGEPKAEVGDDAAEKAPPGLKF